MLSVWSSVEVRTQCAEKLAAGHTARAIAEDLSARFNIDISRNMVIGWAHRNGYAIGNGKPRRPADKPPKPPREARPPKPVPPPTSEPKPRGRLATFSKGCQWIHGDPATPKWRMCAAPTEQRYCPFHLKRLRA